MDIQLLNSLLLNTDVAKFYKLNYFEELDSTQSQISKLALQNAPEGSVVFTQFQSEGRGRLNRSWESPKGKNLLFSLLLYPSSDKITQLTLVMGVALQQALSKFFSPLQLKWPNDILGNNKKLAGVLCEMKTFASKNAVIVGVGINVNSNRDDFSSAIIQKSTSLKILSAREFKLEEVAAELLIKFYELYSLFIQHGWSSLIKMYNAAALPLGTAMDVQEANENFNGTYAGISEEGFLKLNTNQGEKIILAGDIKVKLI